jgi:hypothetical protein
MVDPVGGGGRGPCPACLPLGTRRRNVWKQESMDDGGDIC